MRKWIVAAGLVMVLAVLNGMVWQKEKTLREGTTVLLKLAPVDPRSLMQGDYMALNYEIARQVPSGPAARSSGKLVLMPDPDGVAQFVRVHGGEAPSPGEILLAYKHREGIRLGAESFFFQEGQAALYARAVYGELRVDPEGNSVLVGLRDKDRKPMGRPGDKGEFGAP